MKYTSAFIFLALIAIASAEFGYYVPKAFYTIDANGEQSPLSLISPHSQQKILHRLKRQTFSSSSSSSSSSSQQAGGGPVYFQQTSSNHVGGTGTGFATGGAPLAGSLADRFGGDDGSTSSSSNLPQGGQGVYTQTSGILYPSGQVHYQTNTGKFRK